MHNSGVIILCGGFSSRMKFPKSYLLFGQKTFLQTITEKYIEAGMKNIVVVMNKDFCQEEWKAYLEPVRSRITLIENENPEFGRLYSLQLGTEHLKNCDFCFIQNIDNPFLTEKLISELWEQRDPQAYVMPVYLWRGGHPILISNKIISGINAITDYDLSLRELLNTFDKKTVETDDGRILFNINTKEDYDFYIQKRSEPIPC